LAADISIVVLCYREGKRVVPFIQSVVNEISRITSNWEVVLVGNYNITDLKKNNDETPYVVRDIASKDSRIVAVALEKKGMMGWDARAGLDAATGRTIAIIDGDGQMSPEDICIVYQKLINEKLDMAKTYRSQRLDGTIRKLNSNIYNIFFRMLFPSFHVHDINSKPKIFTRDFLNKLNLTSDDWFFDAEVMIQTRRLKGKIGEVPTVFHRCENRKSYVRINAILEFLRNMLRARIKEFFIK